jgi:hypothetical protein
VLRDLRQVLATARTKFDYRKRDSDKRAWARVIIGAAAAYGRIIDDNLERRVEALERDRVILKNEK